MIDFVESRFKPGAGLLIILFQSFFLRRIVDKRDAANHTTHISNVKAKITGSGSLVKTIAGQFIHGVAQ